MISTVEILVFVLGWMVGSLVQQVWSLYGRPYLRRKQQYKRRAESRKRNRAKAPPLQDYSVPPQPMPSKSVLKRVAEQTKQESSNG